ncbi:hypothetical protein KY284_020604 [Solanum tuberosum]|nr:hypothetical protein KY284_020604 [Solanum tuberosum]
MTNSFSSSKLPVPLEIENPRSFNFSIPPSEESPSTPVCGVGETGESITLHTEMVASPAHPSGENLLFSHILVLSEEVVVVSKVVSSTMSKRLFDGDLPERKGPKSNILAVAAELVVVQSLASLRGDVQPSLLEQELRSPEQVPHSVQPVFDQTPKSFNVESEQEEEEEVPLVWNRKRVRGANALTVGVPDLETVKSVPDTNFNNELAESAKERKIKGKERWLSPTQRGTRRSMAPGVPHYLLGPVIQNLMMLLCIWQKQGRKL